MEGFYAAVDTAVRCCDCSDIGDTTRREKQPFVEFAPKQRWLRIKPGQICFCCRGILLNPCRPVGAYPGPTGCDQNAFRNANVTNIEQPEKCSQLCQPNFVLRRSFAGQSRTLHVSAARLLTVLFFSCEELQSAMRGFPARLHAHPLYAAGRSGKEDSPANDLQRMRSLNVLLHI